MLEDFQDYHATEKPEARDWMECTGFVVAVPIAYVVAVAIAVTVALMVPEDFARDAAVAVNAAAR